MREPNILLVVLFFVCVALSVPASSDGHVKSNPCRRQNGGCVQNCISGDGSYRCACFPGFTMSRDGRSCDDVNECLVDKGGCQHQCINIIGSYECACDDGYVLSSNEHTCISKDSTEYRCDSAEDDCRYNCTPTPNGDECACRLGYRLRGAKCTRTCEHGNGGCHHKCVDRGRRGTICRCHRNYVLGADRKSCKASSCAVNNGGCDVDCEETPIGVQCSCPLGFNPHSDRRSCEDVDECAVENGGCQHRCRNSHGSYQCSCNSGYKLALDETSCVDIDECEMNDTCSHKCINSQGGYDCSCPKGFIKYAVARCGDVDECAVNNGGCGQNCHNTVGGYRCDCNKGYLLHWNKKDCILESKCPEYVRGEERTGRLGCVPRDKSCSLACQTDEYFAVVDASGKYTYSCGTDAPASEDTGTSRYQWIASRLFVNDSSIRCPGKYANTVRFKTKFKVTAKHCSLSRGNSGNAPATTGSHTTVVAIVVNCESIRRKSRSRSVIGVEVELLLKKPRQTKKCNTKCVEKKVTKKGKIAVKSIRRSISKHQFFLQSLNSDLTIGRKGGIDVETRSGCEVGQRLEDDGKTCVSCEAGTRFDIEADTCTNCSEGFYQDQEGQLSCVPCPNVPPQRLRNAPRPATPITSIINCPGACPPGHFSVYGYLPCSPCPLGTYQPYSGRIGCYECGAGMTTRSVGSISFEECSARATCEAGHYYDIRVPTCIRCPAGFYQPNTGQNYCLKCPSNTTTDFDGATGIDFCKDRRCGGETGHFEGVIESPNYPGDYPTNIRCQWSIIPPKGRKILLVVPEIHLADQDDCGDKLAMRKSASESSILTYETCQSYDNPIAVTARSKRLWIEFTSDGRETAKGFRIPYVTYDENYDTIIKNIVKDGRLYSANYHQEILKDKQSRQTLLNVLAHPEHYFDLLKQNYHGLFPKTFIMFLQQKVITFLSPNDIN